MDDEAYVKGGLRADDLHKRLARLAAQQLGIVERDQLRQLGFTDEQIRRMVRIGWLQSVHHNVYAVGHQGLVQHAYLLAALLSLGPDSFLSHRTAASVWGLRPINVHDVEVTLPGTGGRRRKDVHLHATKTPPHPHDIRPRGLLRASSVVRMLVELAPRETPAELERLVAEGVRKRVLRIETSAELVRVEQALERHAGYPKIGRVRAALAGYRRIEDHKSNLERAFDQLLQTHPEIPDPQRNVYIDKWEIDRYWPQHRLCVELDGRPYHVAVKDMERDRYKDAQLLRLGLTPLRFTDFRFEHDIAGILADLRHFLQISGGQAAA